MGCASTFTKCNSQQSTGNGACSRGASCFDEGLGTVGCGGDRWHTRIDSVDLGPDGNGS